MWSPEPEQRRGTCRWDLLLYTQAVEDKDKSSVTVRLDLLLHETRACFFSQHWPRGGWWQQPPEHQDSAADLQPRGWRPPSRWRCRAFQVPCPSAAARWTIHGCVHVRHRIGGGSEPFYIQVQYLENDYDVWWELSSTVVVVSVSQSVLLTGCWWPQHNLRWSTWSDCWCRSLRQWSSGWLTTPAWLSEPRWRRLMTTCLRSLWRSEHQKGTTLYVLVIKPDVRCFILNFV